MPPTIIPDPTPAPVCNLSPRDVAGLLSDCPRKSIEPMALALGLPIRAMQHFISQSAWRTAPILARHQALVAQTLGAEQAVYLLDESGVVKQGHDSAGVAH